MTDTTTPVLETRDLVKEYPLGGFLARRTLRALGGVNLSLHSSEILALVGESGSGKSTIARCVTRLEQPTSGEILLDGVDVLKTEKRHASREYRGRVQMVFQDPFGSLNPVHRISHFLERALRNHQPLAGAALQDRLEELMATVDLDADMLASYPHELSGGQRQRVAIARALAVDPSVILADEPTSMLDVSVRIGVLNLMRSLRDDKGIAMIYITHDLASARYLADRIAVMFAGEIVEEGDSMEILAHPAHPYTELLVSAVPDPDRSGSYDPVRRARLRQQVLAAETCPFDGDPDNRCSSTTLVRHRVGEPAARHLVRCHLYRPEAMAGANALTATVKKAAS
ncbi:MAG: ATP-binding cassette domain-containing protein [Micropruina sp.]|uniref:ABC transporter ATP-binding protein n=1 Tax=Micropruina sp. TaxID=2737536 RepID=UPI0039E2FF3F